MNLKGSRILVTGGAGLIGSHVVDCLIAEHPKEIIVFDKNLPGISENRSPELDYSNVKLLDGDVCQADDVRKALKGVDFVIHTAAILTRETSENLRAALEINICGTFNLVEASATSGVKKFIYSSSVAVYGDPLVNPMPEDHPFNTASMYGASKVAGELFLRIFKEKSGMDYVALRYATVYGPRQHYRARIALYIPECFDRFDRGLPPIIYGDGSQLYEYVYVGDVARANVVALKSDVTGECFNVGTGVTISVKEVVQMIREITGTSLEPEYVPGRKGFEAISYFLDVTKAEKVLGFKAEVPLREGLQRYYDWRKKKVLRVKGASNVG